MRAKEISLATPFYVVNRKLIVIVYPTSVSYTTNSVIRVMLSGHIGMLIIRILITVI